MKPVWIGGIDHRIESHHPGLRDLTDSPSTRLAARNLGVDRASSSSDPRFHGIRLSRNCGHQNALLAGLLHAEGDALISIYADLQDDLGAIATRSPRAVIPSVCARCAVTSAGAAARTR